MKKFKLFIENFLIYGLGGIIGKFIPIIMVPIVTRLMPGTEYYGISDLSNTVVQFGSTLAVLGMYDAMYRMFFEKENDEFKKDVCSTTLVFTVFMSILVFCSTILFKEIIAKYFLGNVKYSYVVGLAAITTLMGATKEIISAPTRMQNKRKVFLLTNTIGPILSYSIAILLILKEYYVLALPLAMCISRFIMEIIFGYLNYSWFSISRFRFSLLKQLLMIAVPLLPNFLIYWVFNSCDKVMITNMLGIGAAGIYSVGSKLGHSSQLIYTAFAGGWQYFAFSTMKEENQVKTNSIIFEYLGIVSFVATAFICAWSYIFFKILFTEQYWEGYIIAPYLFLAPLLQMLFQVAANQFLVIKKTWPNMVILTSGALVNILVNFSFIPKLGIEGAAIATLLGYILSDIVCIIVLSKMKLMMISFKFIIASTIMLIYLVIWRISFSANIVIGTISALVITIIYIWLYRKDIYSFLKLVRGNYD